MDGYRPTWGTRKQVENDAPIQTIVISGELMDSDVAAITQTPTNGGRRTRFLFVVGATD